MAHHTRFCPAPCGNTFGPTYIERHPLNRGRQFPASAEGLTEEPVDYWQAGQYFTTATTASKQQSCGRRGTEVSDVTSALVIATSDLRSRNRQHPQLVLVWGVSTDTLDCLHPAQQYARRQHSHPASSQRRTFPIPVDR